jgi:tetratricopeptide (TPR) repeat protein
MDRSLIANPNYALGHYARGFIGVHSSQAVEVVPNLEIAQRLSPFDPLLFGMVSAHGISLAVQGKYAEAVELEIRATQESNAHFHIYALAAAALELNGQHAQAEEYVRQALSRHPGYNLRAYQRSFPFRDENHTALMSDALLRAGLPR